MHRCLASHCVLEGVWLNGVDLHSCRQDGSPPRVVRMSVILFGIIQELLPAGGIHAESRATRSAALEASGRRSVSWMRQSSQQHDAAPQSSCSEAFEGVRNSRMPGHLAWSMLDRAWPNFQHARLRVPNLRCSRPVVVSASAEGRRAVLGGLLAGAIAIAPAAQAIEIIDATKVRDAGFDLIYQARDLDLPQVSRTCKASCARMSSSRVPNRHVVC